MQFACGDFWYDLRMSELLKRITIRAEQCHGQPCIRGMRIRVIDVLELLAGGMTHAGILADYPRTLKRTTSARASPMPRRR